MFADLIFLSPWVLTALAAVPVLWWLLRVMPPRPKTVALSSFFFLKGLNTPLKSAAHTPWWLLLLRSLTIILFILAFAGPLLHPAQSLPGGSTGEVLLIVDNDWASASNWKIRQDKLKEYLGKIGRSGRAVIFLPTTASAQDGHLHSYGPMPAKKGVEWVERLRPNPWPASPEAAEIAQKTVDEHHVTHTVFFSAGLDAPTELTKLAHTIITDDETNDPYVLRQPPQNFGQPGFYLERLHSQAHETPLQVMAYSDEGGVIDELKINFPAGKKDYEFSWDLLPEVRNKTARLALHAPLMASDVFLVGPQWRQHPVGIVAAADKKESRDFLSEVYYLKRALEGNNQVSIDTLEKLLKLSLSALILPDSTALTSTEKTALEDWVQRGGFLIRFAGPNLAANADNMLLPVVLHGGQRTMAGAMTWEKPVHLGDISRQSPLAGLEVPPDVTVTKQLLAEPTPETFEKTWLQLEDGSPLVTGGKTGKGTIVLIHTSAGPDWSNFCYSGLYVESLQRMVSLSNGISDYRQQTVLPPLLLMDGFGRLATPDGTQTMAAPVKPDQAFEPSPLTPPGIYGNSQEFRTFNLGDSLSIMQPLKIPATVKTESYKKAGEMDLKPLLLQIAVLLLLIETLATFWLRGLVALATIIFAIFIFSAPATAGPIQEEKIASGIYLGYIKTGDPVIDGVSFNGLTGLSEELNNRTTVKIQGVSALTPDSDLLAYYPLLYWPMTERQSPLSAEAAHNIQNYLAEGGIILFDTRDGQFGDTQDNSTPGARALRELTQNIQIPELISIPSDHILTRSFYLLDEFPGRYAVGKLWVEKEPSQHHDSVTSVVIGGNDWASSWSKNESDHARYLIEPGGSRQREMSYRFGINLVMSTLAGSYKADQVHIPYILQRIGQ